MLVQPLLPTAWGKELDKQKIVKDDADSDLYATGIAERDLAQVPEGKGSPQQDDFIALEGPDMAKLALKLQESLMPWTLFP